MTLIGNLSNKQRVLLSLLVFIILALGISLVALNGTGANDSAQDRVNQASVAPGVQITKMLDLADQNRTLARTAVQYDPRNAESELFVQPLSSLRPQLERNLNELDLVMQAYLASSLSDEERRLANRITTDHKDFVEKGLNPIFAAVEKDRFDEATQLFYRQLEPAFSRYRDGVKELQSELAAQEQARAEG